jgi:hypothetical protein
MTDDGRKALGWVLGAAAVVLVLGLYLWWTAPGADPLSETYSVM